jgi:hypothetical protein
MILYSSIAPPVIDDVVSFSSCIKPVHLPFLIRNDQCCPKLNCGSLPSSNVELNIVIGFHFDQPSGKWGLLKTVLVPTLGQVNLHILVYILSTVSNMQDSLTNGFLSGHEAEKYDIKIGHN